MLVHLPMVFPKGRISLSATFQIEESLWSQSSGPVFNPSPTYNRLALRQYLRLCCEPVNIQCWCIVRYLDWKKNSNIILFVIYVLCKILRPNHFKEKVEQLCLKRRNCLNTKTTIHTFHWVNNYIFAARHMRVWYKINVCNSRIIEETNLNSKICKLLFDVFMY